MASGGDSVGDGLMVQQRIKGSSGSTGAEPPEDGLKALSGESVWGSSC